MKKVSIIVPVYNTKQYLKRCLDSCVYQTMKDIEVIVVDDDSPDGSEEIITEYADMYSETIKPLFLKKNVGHSSACNAGLKCATGDYILFVDSDDWIETDACEKLWNAADKCGADMVGGDIFKDSDYNSEICKRSYTSCKLGHDNIENVYSFMMNCGLYFERIYKRSVLINHNILFPEGISFYGDSYFNTLSALYSNNFIKLDYPFYHYYQHSNQSTKVKNDMRSYDRIKVAEMTVKSCKERGIYEQYKAIIDDKWFMLVMESAVACLTKFDNPDVDIIYMVRNKCKDRMPNYRKNSRGYQAESNRAKLIFNLIMASPKGAVFIYKVAKLLHVVS